MTKTFGDQCLEDILLHPDLSSNLRLEASSGPHFQILEGRFPLCGSKIDWSRIEGALHTEVDATDNHALRIETFAFLEKIIQLQNFKDSQMVVAISDNCFDQALIMQFSDLRILIQDLVELPHHLFILNPKGDWCLVITMEGDLNFGFALH